jgi:hypothetical protein
MKPAFYRETPVFMECGGLPPLFFPPTLHNLQSLQIHTLHPKLTSIPILWNHSMRT